MSWRDRVLVLWNIVPYVLKAQRVRTTMHARHSIGTCVHMIVLYCTVLCMDISKDHHIFKIYILNGIEIEYQIIYCAILQKNRRLKSTTYCKIEEQLVASNHYELRCRVLLPPPPNHPLLCDSATIFLRSNPLVIFRPSQLMRNLNRMKILKLSSIFRIFVKLD